MNSDRSLCEDGVDAKGIAVLPKSTSRYHADIALEVRFSIGSGYYKRTAHNGPIGSDGRSHKDVASWIIGHPWSASAYGQGERKMNISIHAQYSVPGESGALSVALLTTAEIRKDKRKEIIALGIVGSE